MMMHIKTKNFLWIKKNKLNQKPWAYVVLIVVAIADRYFVGNKNITPFSYLNNGATSSAEKKLQQKFSMS